MQIRWSRLNSKNKKKDQFKSSQVSRYIKVTYLETLTSYFQKNRNTSCRTPTLSVSSINRDVRIGSLETLDAGSFLLRYFSTVRLFENSCHSCSCSWSCVEKFLNVVFHFLIPVIAVVFVNLLMADTAVTLLTMLDAFIMQLHKYKECKYINDRILFKMALRLNFHLFLLQGCHTNSQIWKAGQKGFFKSQLNMCLFAVICLPKVDKNRF